MWRSSAALLVLLPTLVCAQPSDGQPADEQPSFAAALDEALQEASTLYIGSMSKTMTAVVALKLSERGNVDLRAPIRNYLPWHMPDAGITLHHLLTPSSSAADGSERVRASFRPGHGLRTSRQHVTPRPLTMPVKFPT